MSSYVQYGGHRNAPVNMELVASFRIDRHVPTYMEFTLPGREKCIVWEFKNAGECKAAFDKLVEDYVS